MFYFPQTQTYAFSASQEFENFLPPTLSLTFELPGSIEAHLKDPQKDQLIEFS